MDGRDLRYALRRLRVRWRRARLDYDREERERADRLATVLDASASTLRDYEAEYDDLDWFHDAYGERVQDVHDAGVLADTTHWRDGKTAYVVCRALEPSVAVETGVRFGSFDAHVLAAMVVTGHGELHGLDLPGGPAGPFEYGHLIPDRCRERWHLHAGDASEDLAPLLDAVGPVDLFLHDSDHRKPHMRFEYETARPRLTDGGVLASHDVRLSSAFESFCAAHGLAACVVADTGFARRPRAES
ncbi:MAG: class I SAM-dependent methyltransferase [Haloarculaceae archaeon]